MGVAKQGRAAFAAGPSVQQLPRPRQRRLRCNLALRRRGGCSSAPLKGNPLSMRPCPSKRPILHRGAS